MKNNALFGFTFQKVICDQYSIVPNERKLSDLFKTSIDKSLEKDMQSVVKKIFKEINAKPVECTTLSKFQGKDLPFNFILDNNTTLSVRTNYSGDKVAPRKVGQAGYDKINQNFSSIFGKQIISQDDIKELVTNKTESILPIFLDNLFDADAIVWVYKVADKIDYKIIKGDSVVDLEFKKENFTFTQGIDTWNESTTLKYLNKSIAEIQVHKERTFKFRFIMKNLISFILEKKNNNETLGMTAEKCVCDMFDLEYSKSFKDRASEYLQPILDTTIKYAFNILPPAIQHTGSLKGERGLNSKCSYDFMLKGDKTLSVKTNIGKMVCPPEVGQPGDKTCYQYFKEYVEGDNINKVSFKEMVYKHIHDMIPIYLYHLFKEDYLLWVYKNKRSLFNGMEYEFDIIEKDFGANFKWDCTLFAFSKKTIDEWNESNTVYYNGISLGEFQVHNNRNCYKFRFNFKNLIQIINNKTIDL
ncbi:MAG: hypothetical protein R3Y21_00010 [Mycoplasmatota bacterium]